MPFCSLIFSHKTVLNNLRLRYQNLISGFLLSQHIENNGYQRKHFPCFPVYWFSTFSIFSSIKKRQIYIKCFVSSLFLKFKISDFSPYLLTVQVYIPSLLCFPFLWLLGVFEQTSGNIKGMFINIVFQSEFAQKNRLC